MVSASAAFLWSPERIFTDYVSIKGSIRFRNMTEEEISHCLKKLMAGEKISVKAAFFYGDRTERTGLALSGRVSE